jgi:hypothetical protein
MEKDSRLCLAHMITQIPSTQMPHLKIFHAVTPGFKMGTTTFAFIPQLEQEARTMVAALLPYLRAKHGDNVFKFFTPAAVDRAQSCKWDPETNQVLSPHDKSVDEATTLDAEFHFEGEVEIEMPATGPAPIQEGRQLFLTQRIRSLLFEPRLGSKAGSQRSQVQ